MADKLQAEITQAEDTWQKNKRYTVYKVVVTVGGKSWFIFRRYTEFEKLHQMLKKNFPDVSFKLPGKKLFGNNFDPNFIKHRREGLHDFVQQLCAQPRVLQHAEVRTFLQLDNPRNKNGSGGDEEALENNDVNGEDSADYNLGPTHNPNARPSDFDFLKVIGKGSFGKVLLARHKTDSNFYAVKVLQKKVIMKRNEAKHIMAERNVLLKNLKHPFLVGLHYSFQTPDKLYFVLDYVNGGELFFHLQRERYFPEPRARFYAAEIASALGYLHSLNIIYRDLKPENILLDSQGHVVLTDFGLCKEGIEASATTSTFCGTPEYLAPEVLRKQAYDRSVDWWCLGAVLYEMLYGLPPFYSRDTAEMYENILYKPLKLRTNISPAARHILEGLLQKEKEDRLGTGDKDFEEVKTHAFFSSLSWQDLLERKIPPPYNPEVSGQLDLKHFDPEFVREPVPGSVGKSTGVISASVQEADAAFMGFSYAPPAEDAFE
ncbi:PREDICTED: serine/threonine-protein kinase Sgk3-like isoform X2 [Branchiostoma belcheri]|uniref:Serine/threonine-protein kinase Sgk3-like isoform X1 n=1 Tax=Branchiostoma belcheri TaxID=7741 RepID=A0A6P4Y3M9_BRABE|nr:PREDICTED: serine/threonine-protein kinase Sgk3-like isoform X1 [Branchiostoma belcheri]XP_019619032.1 PREDICTED: serine/threonine-protein kinase Sgk3-like isoform X1 [Branchiostoma belcheri]XP_019619033.1 PREDICTED: serine/threonine-protein kinase Sgk3-like isoform X2 [Branchiostoma belcheri]KAI8495889.1 Serine/threonine-protein kinase Sgk1 [Branchiostoma belcheri]